MFGRSVCYLFIPLVFTLMGGCNQPDAISLSKTTAVEPAKPSTLEQSPFPLPSSILTEVNKPSDSPEDVEPSTASYEEPAIDIAFAGDVMFDWSIRDTLQKHGVHYPFEQVKHEILKADFAFMNLETAITDRTDKFPGQLFYIKSDANTLDGIKVAGFDLVSIANNHVLDYKVEGLMDTMKALDEKGIPYVGAGVDAHAAYSSKEVIIKGKKFRFLAFSRFLPSEEWYARENRPGMASGYQLDKVISTITEQKEDADYLIVYLHWGVEKTNTPAKYQKEYVKQMVEAGADSIVGSHPHWLQGFEYYNEKPVAYSLGNFLFPSYVRGHDAETGILHMTFKGKEIKMSFSPYFIKNDQIIKVDEQAKVDRYHYLMSISYDVAIDEAGNIVNQRNPK
ncbi:CapA family protein [Paenibacillus sp. LMG 31456]|uniref:CapA family protein n=1 Tax=Paenibacillus foliorum TaxID=2654974 RepID=A0A972GPA7_9BACL|nr:CapA family protein [Paenibacillus foliorum]NOU94369.1 CapA family protein [Paenibacillus foliorum]